MCKINAEVMLGATIKVNLKVLCHAPALRLGTGDVTTEFTQLLSTPSPHLLNILLCFIFTLAGLEVKEFFKL